MKTLPENISGAPPLTTLSTVRQAMAICPFCILGIALIFWAKPSSGATVTGLALWTVIMQAFSAIFLVLLFRAAKAVGDTLEARKTVQKVSLPEKELLEQAFRTGRYAPIDTKPHPEHLPEWMEHNETVLKSVMATFEEKHIMPPTAKGKVRERFHKGVSELIASQPDGGNSFAVSKGEVQNMINRLFSTI
ncbi:MAG: hypothetical protein M0Z37_00250 [Nitrospiraceae bacterium]|nr:hypothetical protein [Nitrospiraceae bacterium]